MLLIKRIHEDSMDIYFIKSMWVVNVWCQDLRLFQTNGESNVLTCFAEAVHELLETFCREWVLTADSSAKRKSRRHFSWTLVLALSLDRLNSFPSDLVLR